MKFAAIALAGALALAGAESAQAVTVTGTVTFSQAINSVNPGIQAKALIVPNSGAQDFTSLSFSSTDLNLGDSFSFNTFVIRTLSTAFEANDLTETSFALTFATNVGTATVTGKTSGVQGAGGSVFGLIDFDGPAVIALGGGQGLFIELADAVFNAGVGGYTPGKAAGATIATNLSVQAIPVPAALPLFLSALGLLGFLGRRRRDAIAA